MRACQLCGCKSWGPVKDPGALETALASDVAATTEATLLECDGCGALGREDLITEAPLMLSGGLGLSPHPLSQSLGAAFPLRSFPVLEGMTQAREALKGMMPEKDPETRTERLVRELIARHPCDAPQQRSTEYARWLVICASGIEAELDARDDAIEKMRNESATVSSRPRNFQTDFLIPVLELARRNGLSLNAPEKMVSLSDVLPLALDCAIAFGALEGQTTNTSLKLSAELEAMYWEKIGRLHALVY